MTINTNELLKKFFPKLINQINKLKEFQSRVIKHVFDKKSTLAIMQTGGGKSLIYWISGKALGTTVVISPLIALIDEQARKLEEQGHKVMVTHGGINSNKQIENLTEFCNGNLNPDFIFASPERIATDGYFEYCFKKRSKDIKLIVIDEIHCVSQWGFDFRPFYKRIPDFLNIIFEKNWPVILGLTATVNPKELKDISNDFSIPVNSILKDNILLRFDVKLNVEKFTTEDEKEIRLWSLLEENKDKKILIYLYRKYNKRGTEDLSKKAQDKGFRSESFHGDMSGDERQKILDNFRNDNVNIIFATNAFGMGIDIPDIRTVIHFMMPESVEQYYQEIGRAGRDGKGADAYILFSNKNVSVRKSHFINKSFPNSDDLKRIWKKISGNKSGLKTLQYFSDEEIQTTLQYFLYSKVLNISSKGFTHINIFKDVKDRQLLKIIQSTKTGLLTNALKKCGLTDKKLFEKLYSGISKNTLELNGSINKCILINCKTDELSDEVLEIINKEIEEKKKYKHDLLDYLVYILNNYDSTNIFQESEKLHQEIGRYLGVDKHSLGKIHKTLKGDWVRSKSEVIICNLLFSNKINYEYEKKLYYNNKDWIEPDFTIKVNNQTIYWEHLGMLGDSKYDERWMNKKEIFLKLKLKPIITKESAILSDEVFEIIKKIKND